MGIHGIPSISIPIQNCDQRLHPPLLVLLCLFLQEGKARKTRALLGGRQGREVARQLTESTLKGAREAAAVVPAAGVAAAVPFAPLLPEDAPEMEGSLTSVDSTLPDSRRRRAGSMMSADGVADAASTLRLRLEPVIATLRLRKRSRRSASEPSNTVHQSKNNSPRNGAARRCAHSRLL